jgi:mannosyl-oligosaccharide alpha-1,2-mannosidase
MDLKDEFAEARQWVNSELTFDRPGKFNTFEITIRVLGGLLSAYHFSHDAIFLEKAVDLADRIMPVFLTASGLPVSFIDLKAREGRSDSDNGGMVSNAEAGTLQLEFKYLSHLTDDYAYWNAVEKVISYPS